MKNMEMKIVDNILTITVDLTAEQGLSKSGKSRVIATSAGNAKIPETDVVIGLNVYRRA